MVISHNHTKKKVVHNFSNHISFLHESSNLSEPARSSRVVSSLLEASWSPSAAARRSAPCAADAKAHRGPPGKSPGTGGSPGVFEGKTEGKLWEFDDFLDFLEDSWRILMIFLMRIQLRKSLSSLKAVIRRQ